MKEVSSTHRNWLVTHRFRDYFLNQIVVSVGALVIAFIVFFIVNMTGVSSGLFAVVMLGFIWLYWLISVIGYIYGYLIISKRAV